MNQIIEEWLKDKSIDYEYQKWKLELLTKERTPSEEQYFQLLKLTGAYSYVPTGRIYSSILYRILES